VLRRLSIFEKKTINRNRILCQIREQENVLWLLSFTEMRLLIRGTFLAFEL